jgi:hypothetical protein
MLLALAACVAPAPPVAPLSGPPPANLLVVPAVVHAGGRQLMASLDAGVHAPLVERGYYAVPVEVALEVLDALGWSAERDPLSALPLDRLRADYGIAAVLTTEVEAWGFGAVRGDGRIDVTWQLVPTDGGAVLWSRREHGDVRAQSRELLTGPFFSDEPLLGRDFIRWTTEPDEVAGEAYARRLPRLALARLPRVPE